MLNHGPLLVSIGNAIKRDDIWMAYSEGLIISTLLKIDESQQSCFSLTVSNIDDSRI